MKYPIIAHRRGIFRARLGLFAFRVLTAQFLLISTVCGAPGLFRHAPELEGPVESSVIGHELACERAGHIRLRTKAISALVEHKWVLAETTGVAMGQPPRGVAPRWLRYDLPAPLLC